MEVNKKGVHNWLGGIIIPTRTLGEQLGLLCETFDCLRLSKLSVNLSRWEFCFFCDRVAEDYYRLFRHQTCSEQNRGYDAVVPAISEMEEQRGKAGCLRKFVPNNISVQASQTLLVTHAFAVTRTDS